MIAERLAGGAVVGRVRAALEASPVDPSLKHFCDRVPSDVIADVSTWAEQYRPAWEGRFDQMDRYLTRLQSTKKGE